MTPLRRYQQQLRNAIYAAASTPRPHRPNIMAVLPTGGGKTQIFSNMIAEQTQTYSIAIAHRQELTSQVSMALARNGIRHRVIAAKSTVREIVQMHMEEFRRDYTDVRARAAVAGVDTLLNHDPKDPWLQQIGFAVIDEGHHVLRENKWGTAMNLLPNAWGLFPTATPRRADGKGLGRHADGLADALVTGPSMRDLIDMGFLTDYRIFAPPCDVDLSHVNIGESGEFNQAQLRNAVHESGTLVGDVVGHYLRIARGKLGVTFAVDIEEANKIAAEFRRQGIPAEVVTGKTPALARSHILAKFRRREILQLVNVDLFGEGFDLPAIEVVSMARPTNSYSLFVQQFGRALRLMVSDDVRVAWDSYSDAQRREIIAHSSKPRALIIDHVSNVVRHGLPDATTNWSLDRKDRRSRSHPTDVIPVRRCLNPECMDVYERVLVCCPSCGHKPEPAERSTPDQVDGDLIELDENILAALRGEIVDVNAAAFTPHTPAQMAQVNHIENRRTAQVRLREAMAVWVGHQTHNLHRSEREALKRFYFMFGIDVLSAQALNGPDARELEARISNKLLIDNIVSMAQTA